MRKFSERAISLIFKVRQLIMIIGKRLKRLRDNKNFTQEEFAARLEINRSMVAKYEAGQTMGLEIRCKLKDAAGKDTERVIHGTVHAL